MKTQNTYQYNFKNGNFTISKLKFDWELKIALNDDENGVKQLIYLDQRVFLTRKTAKENAEALLSKYELL